MGRTRISRRAFTVAVGTSDTPLLSSNPRRWGLLINPTRDNINSVKANSQAAAQVSTAAAGTALTFTVPAGKQDLLLGATAANFVGGAPTVALQLIRGASTIELVRGTTAINFSTGIQLSPADVIRWQILTGVAATTVDFTLSLQESNQTGLVTITFGQPAAVVDQGVNLHPGNPALMLSYSDFG